MGDLGRSLAGSIFRRSDEIFLDFSFERLRRELRLGVGEREIATFFETFGEIDRDLRRLGVGERRFLDSGLFEVRLVEILADRE